MADDEFGETPRADYDEAWKELLDLHLEPVLRCFVPHVYDAIDWSQSVEFLDQELRDVLHDTSVRSFRVDRLIKVFRKDGGEQWLLLHFEIQSFPERDFETRLYHYNHSIHRAWGRQPVSLVILADLDPAWHPREYFHEELGCETRFRFLTCKLLDAMDRLEDDFSLPAVVAKAQIEALRTTGKPRERFEVRWRLTRALYDHGFSREEIVSAYRFLAWMMRLPLPLQLTFREKVLEFEKAEKMPYITDIEEIGIEKGLKLGLSRGLEQGLSQGLSQGRQDGTVRIATILLERVCGPLDETRRARVGLLPLEKAERLAEAILDFRSMADLDAWLARNA